MKFACRNCGNTIVVQYLKVGEVAKCPQCQTPNIVPEDAGSIDEKQEPFLPTGMTPEAADAISPDDFEKIMPEWIMSPQYVARILTGLFWGLMILVICSFVFDYLEYNLLSRYLNGEYITDAEINANDTRQRILGFIYLLVNIAASITFLVWFYRAHKNLYRARVPDIKYKSGWTIGGFFVPIICFFRPFQLMKETYKGSLLLYKTDYIRNWDEYETNPLVGWWWALFLISIFFANFVISFILSAETAGQLRTSAIFNMANSALEIPLILLTIYLIKDITRLQEEARRKANLGMMGQPVG